MRYGLFFYRGKSICPTEDDYSLDFWYVGAAEASRYDSPVSLPQKSINELASDLILIKSIQLDQLTLLTFEQLLQYKFR